MSKLKLPKIIEMKLQSPFRIALTITLIAVVSTSLLAQKKANWENQLEKAQSFAQNEQDDLARLYFPNSLSSSLVAHSDSSQEYGICALSFGDFYLGLQEYQLAEGLLLKAKFCFSYTQSDSLHCECLISLGTLYQVEGKYELDHRVILELNQRTKDYYGDEHERFGETQLALCYYFISVGDYSSAEKTLQNAEEIVISTSGKSSDDYAQVLHYKALLRMEDGKLRSAEPYFKQAKDLYSELYGESNNDYGIVLNDLADLYEMMARYDEALDLHFKSLKITEINLGKDHHEYGISLHNIALVYQSAGRFDEAIVKRQEALANIKRSLGIDHPTYSKMLGTYGSILMGQNKVDEALPYYMLANESLLKQVEEIFKFRTEKEAAAFLKRVLAYFEMYQSINYRLGRDFENGYSDFLGMNLNNHLSFNGVLLNSFAGVFQKLRELQDPLLDNELKEFIEQKDHYTKQLSLSPNKRASDTDSLLNQIEIKEAKLIQEYSNRFGKSFQIRQDWTQIQEVLKPEEIAIEFSRFEYSDQGYYVDSFLYAAYLIRADWQAPRMIYLFEEEELKSTLRSSAVYSYVARGTEVQDFDGDSSLNYFGLFDLIWKPLEKHLEDINTIYFSPDGMLHEIPLAVLEDFEGMMTSKYKMVQLSSTAVLDGILSEPEKKEFLLIGGLNYNLRTKEATKPKSSATDSTYFAFDDWNYLPGTKLEVEEIALLLKNKRLNYSILDKIQGSEKAIKELSGNSPSIMHFATHGFLLTKADFNASSQEEKARFPRDPLLRSGLVLSGGNDGWNPSQGEDNLLTALEISNLDFSQTDLVVLSACESGLGDIIGIEGVYGLQRAFKKAGVDLLVMSLWKVPDKETSEFMASFYKFWINGLPVRKAFGETQNFMASRYPGNPEKWAAFVLIE